MWIPGYLVFLCIFLAVQVSNAIPCGGRGGKGGDAGQSGEDGGCGSPLIISRDPVIVTRSGRGGGGGGNGGNCGRCCNGRGRR